jgi:hypothetical protein
MDLPREQSSKLRKYFINADPFLWGVLVHKNKKDRIKELKELGLFKTYVDGGNPIYTKINRDLMIELGINGILEQIVIPRIITIFNADNLRHFQDCWEQGQTPDLDYLIQNKLYRPRIVNANNASDYFHTPEPLVSYRDLAFIFLQIDTQHNFVERWTVFAGLWFEEISQYIDQVGKDTFKGLLTTAEKTVNE